MATAQPIYSLTEQYQRLSDTLPYNFRTIEYMKLKLLTACSDDGDLPKAKNRLLNLIQDTEIQASFLNMLEPPSAKLSVGIKPISLINGSFLPYYKLLPQTLLELRKAKVANHIIQLFEELYESNQDPVYKLSVIAAVIMMAIIYDDKLNQRKE